MNLGSGLTHTITGTWTRTAGILNGGSSMLVLTGLTPISGTGGTFTPSTGTIEYGAAGNQTIGVFTYYNLKLSGSGTKTLGIAKITNNLSIYQTALASLPAATTDTIASLSLDGYGKNIWNMGQHNFYRHQ